MLFYYTHSHTEIGCIAIGEHLWLIVSMWMLLKHSPTLNTANVLGNYRVLDITPNRPTEIYFVKSKEIQLTIAMRTTYNNIVGWIELKWIFFKWCIPLRNSLTSTAAHRRMFNKMYSVTTPWQFQVIAKYFQHSVSSLCGFNYFLFEYGVLNSSLAFRRSTPLASLKSKKKTEPSIRFECVWHDMFFCRI